MWISKLTIILLASLSIATTDSNVAGDKITLRFFHKGLMSIYSYPQYEVLLIDKYPRTYPIEDGEFFYPNP